MPASIFVALVTYTNDGFVCQEAFDTMENAKQYIALLEAGKVTITYDKGTATVDYIALRGSNWVNIYASV
jgi:hypothetical protein